MNSLTFFTQVHIHMFNPTLQQMSRDIDKTQGTKSVFVPLIGAVITRRDVTHSSIPNCIELRAENGKPYRE